MTLPAQLGRLRLPVIGAPMFIVSQPALVTAQCKAGIVGSFPALNARPAALLRTWITEIRAELANLFSGVPANYLRASIEAVGLDPDHLPTSDPSAMSFASHDDAAPIKQWRDIWGSGQGIGAVHEVVATAALVARLEREYRDAREALG